MSEIPSDIIQGLNVAERIGSSIYDHVKENRAYARTVAVELRQNIELIALYRKAGTNPEAVISKLSNAALMAALGAGFNFGSLKRSRIGAKSVRQVAQLQKYKGWSTQKAFERLCTKISTIKHVEHLPNNNGKIRASARLNNLFRYLIMLARHIEA